MLGTVNAAKVRTTTGKFCFIAGAARAAFDGIVIAHNEALGRKPGLLNDDPFGAGWLLIVQPTTDSWRESLVTEGKIAPAFEAWFATGLYKDRAD